MAGRIILATFAVVELLYKRNVCFNELSIGRSQYIILLHKYPLYFYACLICSFNDDTTLRRFNVSSSFMHFFFNYGQNWTLRTALKWLFGSSNQTQLVFSIPAFSDFFQFLVVLTVTVCCALSDERISCFQSCEHSGTLHGWSVFNCI